MLLKLVVPAAAGITASALALMWVVPGMGLYAAVKTTMMGEMVVWSLYQFFSIVTGKNQQKQTR